jgi:hypothetical protein
VENDTQDIVAQAMSGITEDAAPDVEVADSGDVVIADDSANTDESFEAASDEAAAVADEPVTEAVSEDPPQAQPAEPVAETPAKSTGPKSLKDYEAELAAANPKLTKGRLPVLRHQAVLAKTRFEHEQAVAPLREKVAQFDSPQTQSQLKLANLAAEDPERFVGVLLHDARYQKVIERVAMEIAKTQASAPAANAAGSQPVGTLAELGPEPKPDVLNLDGSLGYSESKQQELVDWKVRKAQIESGAQVTDMQRRLEAMEAEIEERAQTRMREDAKARVHSRLSTARETWPMFAENEAAIGAELRKPGNERMSLDDAYRAVVVIPRMKPNEDALRAKIRAEVLAEINKAPVRAPMSRPSSPDVSAAGDGVLTTEQIVRRQMRAAAQ